jgi:hypothetical protein
MADKKISQLTAASTPLTGTEELAIVQSGSTVKATAQDVADLAPAPSLGYLVYSALVSQTGINDPTLTEISDTLGLSVSLTRDGVGVYSANLGSAPSLDLSKLVILSSSPGIYSFGPYPFIIPSVKVTQGGPSKFLYIRMSAVDSAGGLLDFELSDTNRPLYVEIRVYP